MGSNRILSLALAVTAALAFASCAEERPDRSFVQELALKKSAFQGEWHYAATAIDSSYEASWTFAGQQELFLHRISWKIEKGFLYAYRTAPNVRGADRDYSFRDDNATDEPIAAFSIAKHFDIRHRYNSVNGEEYNIIEENTSDRLWYEREFMRVDWSKNLINTRSYVYQQLWTAFDMPAPTVQPVAFFVEDPHHPLAPKFIDDDGDGILEYVDVVHQVTVVPHVLDVWDGNVYIELDELLPAQMTIRNSFRRITGNEPSYEPLYYPDTKFEEFGLFRNERRTYDDHRRETDFLDYFANRWNIWEGAHTDTECVAHIDCEQVDSHCDFYHHLCTRPHKDRTERPIVYVETVNYPEKYRKVTEEIENGWNRAVQEVVNQVKHEGAKKLACIDDSASDGCCTRAQRADGAAECVVDMWILRRNSCEIDNVKAYLDRHAELWDEVVDYIGDTKVTADNLVKACGATEAASRRAGIKPAFTWEQIGDIRNSYISYVHNPSRGSPLGYGPTYADPETGESISAGANVYGAALDSYEGYIGDLYDLVDGYVDDDRFTTGEHVREYFQNAGQATGQPTVPHVYMPKPPNLDPAAVQKAFQGLHDRFREIEVMEKQVTFGSNVKKLAGTYIEDMVVNEEYLIASGVPPGVDMTEEILDKVSPFRDGAGIAARQSAKLRQTLGKLTVFPLEEYTDFSIVGLIREARCVSSLPDVCQGACWRDFDSNENGRIDGSEDADMADAVVEYRANRECRQNAIDWILGRVYRAVMEHEIGHTMGLRHNFAGSFDEEGYPDAYWEIKGQLPDPPTTDFAGDDGELDANEWQRYNEALALARQEQDILGRREVMYASIMDYGAQPYSDFVGLGKYDLAAIKFAYGGIREVFDGQPNQTRSNRIHRPYWMGGEICARDLDCPSHDQGASGEGATGVTQTCGVRDRTQGREAWKPIAEAGGKGFCSNWDEDMGRVSARVPAHLFCSDERVGDQAHCSRFDEGASSIEIVENMIGHYERQYIFNNFRRYRRRFGGNGYVSRIRSRYFSVIGKQFQSMVWRIFYQDGFSTDEGAGGFRDMFSASITAMNFFGNVLNRPAIGPYRYSDRQDMLIRCGRSDRFGSCSDDTASEYDVTLGNGGKYLYSTFEQGYYGAINRMSQMGTFLDKWLAIEALATRSWSTAGGNDESIPLNFYDAFGDSMLDLFSGVITENYDRFAPIADDRDGDGIVDGLKYRDYWYGTFFGGPVDRDRLLGYDDTRPVDPDQRLLDPGLSIIHRIVAMTNSLALFSSFFDANYADYVQLKQYDLTTSEAGIDVEEPEEDDPNPVVEYRSPLRGRIYRAVQTDDRLSIAADLVAKAAEARERYVNARTDDERDRARRDVESAESFLSIAADIIHDMGIAY